jgi:hypothetical protein
MSTNNLPDLTDWQKVEVWTIDEAALLWAAIDPHEVRDSHIDFNESLRKQLFDTIDPEQERKAKIFRRAFIEGVCNGTLPFTKAFEMHDDYDHGAWEKEVTFPDLPDPDKLISSRVRVQQAAFMKWVKSKNIPSYRTLLTQSSLQEERAAMFKLHQHESQIKETAPPLQLPAPSLLSRGHPFAPSELIAANEIWEIVASDETIHTNGKSVKKNVLDAINNHPEHKGLGTEAKERICTVTNWNKKGGAPKTP